MCSFTFVNVGNTLTISASTQCLCSNALLLHEQWKNNFIFTCTNKLEYVFFLEKRGVQINRVYKLVEFYSNNYRQIELNMFWWSSANGSGN